MNLPIFPDITKFAWNSKKRQIWENVYVQKSANGRRKSLCTQSYPTWEIEAAYPNLSNYEKDCINGFFASVQGQTGKFLWKDPEDYEVNGVRIGTGDGVTTDFQLIRNLGDYFLEPVRDPIANTIQIFVNGVLSSFTLLDDGWIKFANPPTNGTIITAYFEYYWRVALNDNNTELTCFWIDSHEMSTFTVVSVR
jgi:uncharacterized protein (TIGR02217 family)